MALNNIFTIELPEGWKETSIYTFEGPDDNGIKHNLVLMIDRDYNKELELKYFAKGQLEVMKQTLPGFEFINEQEAILDDKSPFYLLVYKYCPAEEKTYYQKQYFFLKKNTLLMFTATFTKKTMQTIAIDVEKMISSLVYISEKEMRTMLDQ